MACHPAEPIRAAARQGSTALPACWLELETGMLRRALRPFSGAEEFRQAISASIQDDYEAFASLPAALPAPARAKFRARLVQSLRRAIGFNAGQAADARLLVGQAGGILSRDLWAACDLLVPRHPGGRLRSPDEMAAFLLGRIPGNVWPALYQAEDVSAARE